MKLKNKISSPEFQISIKVSKAELTLDQFKLIDSLNFYVEHCVETEVCILNPLHVNPLPNPTLD